MGTGQDVQTIAGELTKFQIRALATVACQDRHGIGIKDELESYYGKEVNHGRLYPNLDELVDLGLIEKGSRDRRTNNYSITEPGRRVLQHELSWLEEQVSRGDDA
ncbi:PadR family transcriptional regulator [Natrinema halophilum]|uniref:PadR family transcriptional regulator n=1 Tax=Natrinema halophilum TaxID=1699371 RepID=UPI001F2BE3E6|nr:PadR family transcriptional regulator [Natrinema halophilum]UHQ96487.1 PadR family transcriptional regulator [Natrinema halophilum]